VFTGVGALRQALTVETTRKCTCGRVVCPTVDGMPHATTHSCVRLTSDAVSHAELSTIISGGDIEAALRSFLRETPARDTLGRRWTCSKCRTARRRLADYLRGRSAVRRGVSAQPSRGAIAHGNAPCLPHRLQPRVDGVAAAVQRRRFTSNGSVLAIELPVDAAVSSDIVGDKVSLRKVVPSWAEQLERAYAADPRLDVMDYVVASVVGVPAAGFGGPDGSVAADRRDDDDGGHSYVTITEDAPCRGVTLHNATVRSMCVLTIVSVGVD